MQAASKHASSGGTKASVGGLRHAIELVTGVVSDWL
jgi:hypothetical protein